MKKITTGLALPKNSYLVDKTDIFMKGLECYSTSTLDLVDASLWTYQVVKQEDIFTFDDKLHEYIQWNI